MASDTIKDNHFSAEKDNHFLVLVHGVELDDSSDFLVAHESARLYREIGWKDVKVKGERI